MTSPLQVLFFFAVTLAPPGTHHVVVSGGDEVYSWDKGDALDDADTWVYDWADVNPTHVLVTNDIVPADFTAARHETAKAAQSKNEGYYSLYFDSGHQLLKTSQGYVYVVRPGSTNEKFYSFSFR